jgi:hypothetical protein
VLSASIHANNYALQVLSLTDGRWTLDDVLRTQSDKAWISELINNVVSIANDRLPVTARHILHTDRSNFIPTMRRLDRINGGRQLSLSVELIEFAGETDSWAFFGRPIASDKWPEVFVLMPFSSDIDPIYRDHITEVVSKKMTLSLKRADDFYTNHAVMQDVWSAIYHAQVIIADCTGKNANVFYEIGIAHTLGKQTILISQKTGDIPFDVQHIRSIVYEYTPRGVREFEKKLEDTLSLVVKQSHD